MTILRSGKILKNISQLHYLDGCIVSKFSRMYSRSRTTEDKDYTLQVGRAIRTLRLTLPTFFEHGLCPTVYPPSSGLKQYEEQIYDQNVSLHLPHASINLPPLRGRALYLRSATLLRLAFLALHSDAQVTLNSTRYFQRELRISLIVNSRNRLTGELSEWDVLFRYTFNDHGLIEVHEVLRINPPPTASAIEGLKVVWARLAGYNPEPANYSNNSNNSNHSSHDINSSKQTNLFDVD